MGAALKTLDDGRVRSVGVAGNVGCSLGRHSPRRVPALLSQLLASTAAIGLMSTGVALGQATITVPDNTMLDTANDFPLGTYNGGAVGAVATLLVNSATANTGFLYINDTGNIYVSVDLHNAGEIAVYGELAVAGYLSNAGDILNLNSTRVFGVLESSGVFANQTGANLVINQGAFRGGVVNEGRVLFMGGGTNYFSGGIVGPGTVEAAAGRSILTGDLSASAFTVIGGTLEFGDGTAAVSVTGNIVNNATVVFNPGSDIVYAGAISGSGSLTKRGAGTLTLTGDNAVGATVLVSGGQLAVQGGGTVTNRGTIIDSSSLVSVRDSGSQLSVDGELRVGASSAGSLAVANGGRVVSNGSYIGVSGTGSVTIAGSNSRWENTSYLVVGSGANGFLTITDGGTLNTDRGVIGQFGSAKGTVTVSGAGSSWTSTDSIRVDGELNIANQGTVTVLGGAVMMSDWTLPTGVLNIGAQSGATAVTAGRLIAPLVDFGAGAGTLVFNHTGNADGSALNFDVGMTGLGTIRHENGKTVLSGGNGGFTGTTNVSGGTLVVNSTLGSSTTGLNVTGSGVLGGTGQVGAVSLGAGASLAPGNSIGIINAGSVDFGAGSVFAIEVNDGGTVPGVNHDQLVASGAVTIDAAARVKVIAENAGDGLSYAANSDYEIIRAGSVSGQFNSVVDHNFAFLNASLAYTPNTVRLNLARNFNNFASVATSPNQVATARVLEGFSATDPVSQAITGMSAEQARTAFDNASGEVHASRQHLIDATFAMFASSLNGAGSGPGGTTAQIAPLAYAPANRSNVPALTAIDDAQTQSGGASAWLAPLAGFGTIHGDGNGAQFNWAGGGIAAGVNADTTIGGGTASAGIGLGYIHSSGQSAARGSRLDADGVFAGIHGNWTDGTSRLSGKLAYGGTHVASTRDIAIGAVSRRAEASYWTHAIGLGLEASHGFELSEDWTIAPLATLDLGWVGHAGATETGAGNLNAQVQAASFWTADIGLGLELGHEIIQSDGSVLTLKGRALWQHGLGDTTPDASLTLAGGGGAFKVSGPEAARNRLVLGAGLNWMPDDATQISLDYAATAAATGIRHGVTAKFARQF